MISFLENLKDKQNKEEVFLRRHQVKKRLEIPPETETPIKLKKIEIIGNDSELIDNNGKLNISSTMQVFHGQFSLVIHSKIISF